MQRVGSWVLTLMVGAGPLFMSGFVSAEPDRFVLNPPLNETRDVVMRRTVEIWDQAIEEGPLYSREESPLYSERTETREDHIFSLEEGAIWLTVVLKASGAYRNNEPSRNVFREIQIEKDIGYALDFKGRIKDMSGLEPLVAHAQAVLGENAPSTDNARTILSDAWRSSYGFLLDAQLDRNIRLGSAWRHTYDLDITGVAGLSLLPVEGEWTVVGRRSDAARTVSLRYRYTAQGIPLEEKSVTQLSTWLQGRTPSHAGASWATVSAQVRGILLSNPSIPIGGEWWDHKEIIVRETAPSERALRLVVETVSKTVQ